jgi:CHASE2 domain-containing sensor protein
MSEIDQVKEEIGFYKLVWATLVAILAGLIGWFALNSNQDMVGGLAIASIFVLSIVWIFVQFKIFKLIDMLKDL